MSIRSVLFAVAWTLSLALNVAAEDTQQRLAKFGQDLSTAWTQYPLEKDTTVRKQKITDLVQSANVDIPKLDASDGITLQRATENFRSSLQKTRSLLKQDKMSAERQQYVTICALAYRRETTVATDITADRTASRCFEIITDWADAGRDGLRMLPADLHSQYYSALNEVFSRMIKTASKDAADPTEIYDKQMKEIRRRFPTAGTLAVTNQPVVSLLETASKQVNTRNKAP